MVGVVDIMQMIGGLVLQFQFDGRVVFLQCGGVEELEIEDGFRMGVVLGRIGLFMKVFCFVCNVLVQGLFEGIFQVMVFFVLG